MEGIAKASGVGSFVGENDRVDLVVTFSEPVKDHGKPQPDLGSHRTLCRQCRLPKYGRLTHI